MWVEHLIILGDDEKKKKSKARKKTHTKIEGKIQQKILMVFSAWVFSSAKNKDSLI